MRAAIAIAGLIGLAGGCSKPSQPAAAAPAARQFVAPAEAHRLVEKEGALLLDVRTPQEFAAGHVPGAVNIPVQELPARLDEIGAPRKIVVYCHSGRRSTIAAGVLEKKGHDVANLGPMTAWGSK